MSSFDIEKEVEISRINRATTLALRDYIFKVIDETNIEVFGERSSLKCAQTALATAFLLSKLGVKTVYILGSICVPKISTNLATMDWHGFWGGDHHYWIMTEFGEIVDISVAYLHMHPQEKLSLLEMPPIWINTNQGVPACFKYLHSECFNVDYSEGMPKIVFLENNDVTSTLSPEDEMIEYWTALEQNIIEKNKTDISRFPCLISEGITEHDLHVSNSAYLNAIPKFLDANIELPLWIIQTEAELMAPYFKPS